MARRPKPTAPTTPKSAPIAKSFYDRLAHEGFTHAQVVALATDLLDLVHRDLRAPSAIAEAK